MRRASTWTGASASTSWPRSARADDVKPVTETVQALLTLGRNAAALAQRTCTRPDPEPLREASDWAVRHARHTAREGAHRGHRARRYGCEPVHPSTWPVRPGSSARSPRHGPDRSDPNSQHQQSQADRSGIPQLTMSNNHFPRPCCTAERAARCRIAGGLLFCRYLEQAGSIQRLQLR